MPHVARAAALSLLMTYHDGEYQKCLFISAHIPSRDMVILGDRRRAIEVVSSTNDSVVVVEARRNVLTDVQHRAFYGEEDRGIQLPSTKSCLSSNAGPTNSEALRSGTTVNRSENMDASGFSAE